MHLIISHAAGAGVQCQAAIAQLALPNLDKLLRRLHTTRIWHGAPENLTPLPERVLADSLGLCGQDSQDGLVPWAAAEAKDRGLTAVHGAAGWAWVTPCHWRAHAQHVEMLGPAELDLRSDEGEALRTSMAGYFAEDGIALHPSTHKIHERWLAFGSIFHDLPTASLQRVSNAGINPWLPRQPQAKGLRRLQSEMQMLLYTHPVNDAREARGAPSVNAFWISGTGTLPAAYPDAISAPCTVVDTLRHSAVCDDAPSWTASWQTLDQVLLADALARARAGGPLQLTLCGENKAVTLAVQQQTWWQSLHQRLRATPVLPLLQSL